MSRTSPATPAFSSSERGRGVARKSEAGPDPEERGGAPYELEDEDEDEDEDEVGEGNGEEEGREERG